MSQPLVSGGHAWVVDAHPRGPFSAAGALVRQVIRDAHARVPELVRAHELTLLSVVPELTDYVPVSGDVVRSFAFSREGNAPSWTLRLAHGLTEFFLGYVAGACPSRCSVTFENVDFADPTDKQLIEVLSRRAAPDRLSVRTGTSAGPVSEPTATVESLLAASTYAMRMAYYDAALHAATRGRLLFAGASHDKKYGELTRNALFALLLLGRFGEVEDLCAKVREESDDPALLAHAAYATAILNARLYDVARRDYDAAAAAIEASRGFTERLPPSSTRAVNLAFLQNTKALVEMRQGRPAAAIQLLSDALEYLAREAPEGFALESGIIFHNRARVHIALGDLDSAVAGFTTLLQNEPSSSEAYFDRAVLFQRSGKSEAALSDYDAAIKWSPPYGDPHFNRAQILETLGRTDEALAEYNYVLVLEPELSAALVNRACLLFERGDLEASQVDVARALRGGPPSPRLLCVQGLLQLRGGNLGVAEKTFTDALTSDPALPDAWANRATVRFKRGEHEAAALDLTQALALREDATILSNRGRVFEAQQRWEEAASDYARAIALLGGDAPKIARRRERCLSRL